VLIDLHATGPSAGRKRAAGGPVLEHPLATEWLTLRAATCNDADPTWKFRQLTWAVGWDLVSAESPRSASSPLDQPARVRPGTTASPLVLIEGGCLLCGVGHQTVPAQWWARERRESVAHQMWTPKRTGTEH
jgi:hypothetical protein